MYEKGVQKMLMKLIPALNDLIINLLKYNYVNINCDILSFQIKVISFIYVINYG